eukprot:GHVU01001958.1.p1 GENE.GHVU01001958.1~~GHVU01001958.1.p1  ORF type:complete len:100 (+),score=1.43 GHVU01001958.1:99-398(+)
MFPLGYLSIPGRAAQQGRGAWGCGTGRQGTQIEPVWARGGGEGVPHTYAHTQTHLSTPNPCRTPFRHSPSCHTDPSSNLRIHGGTQTVWRLAHTHIHVT